MNRKGKFWPKKKRNNRCQDLKKINNNCKDFRF